MLFNRVRYGEVQWLLLTLAAVMTLFGLTFVISATGDPATGWGREAKMQVMWWLVACAGCLTCMHVSMVTWRQSALVLFLMTLGVQLAMIVLAGTPFVPTIKGAHNWIAIGPARVQPSEFYKLASLLMTARLLANPHIDIRRFGWSLAVLGIGCLPAVLIAREDLGSAMTFAPMVIGMLILAGMPLRYVILGVLVAVALAGVGISMLDEQGYQYKRLQAWLAPEQYALTEGFQTIRSLRSIGSGQWVGKGYASGDQNLLGWLPEKHTDMIFAVIGEELGFVGAVLVPLLFLGFAIAGLYAAAQTRDPFGRLVIGGFTCLIIGQATINLMVVMGLMPVTGITLPFFSYGGSSLLGTWCGLGICAAASAAPTSQMQRTVYS